jgi:hypothetical protein
MASYNGGAMHETTIMVLTPEERPSNAEASDVHRLDLSAMEKSGGNDEADWGRSDEVPIGLHLDIEGSLINGEEIDSPSRIADVGTIQALLDAGQTEQAMTTLRALLAGVLTYSLGRASMDEQMRSAIVENVMKLIEPILHSNRGKRTSMSDERLSSMAVALGSTGRLATDVALSGVLPGTLAALLIARTERQAGQIQTLLHLAGKLADR